MIEKEIYHNPEKIFSGRSLVQNGGPEKGLGKDKNLRTAFLAENDEDRKKRIREEKKRDREQKKREEYKKRKEERDERRKKTREQWGVKPKQSEK